jgi:PKD repeat protein
VKHNHILNIFIFFSLTVLAWSAVSCRNEPPSIILFTATPAEINSGASSTLKWDVKDATTVTIDQGIGKVEANGSKELSPSKTTAYTLTATNSGGTVTKAVVLYITEPPPPPPAPPAADTTPPVITNVSTSSETETGAVITWTTNEPASSVVEYGQETDYGLTTSSPELTTDHSVTLSDLAPNTAYHFRVTSSDKAGNQASSADNIFVTAQEKSTYSLALLSMEWGRRTETSSLGLGDSPVEGKKYLYVKATLQNRSQGSLRAVICTMNCWSAGTIVKYEVYVHRTSVLPGQIFSINIEIADDPTVDNVTVDFADALGKDIVVINERQ